MEGNASVKVIQYGESLYNVRKDIMEAMKVVITMEVYKEIRRLHMEGHGQRWIARQLGISRNTVKKYMEGGAVPWEKKGRERKETSLTPEVKAFIERCLKQDEEEGTKKQHHTAKRIYERLVKEQGYGGGESTVRGYVREVKGKAEEAYVPLEFAPGEAVQIDWGEVQVWLEGQRVKANLFCARLCYSDAPFVVCYRRQNGESFQDALVRTMEYFGGTPKRVIFDNARVAVKEGFGAQAKATESYQALAAHYGFETVFCNPSSGNEKGLVEGLVGFSRRNFCVPVPRVTDMGQLNGMLQERCEEYLGHTVAGKGADVGTLFREEQGHLYSLPKYRYDPAKRAEARVNAFSTVRFETNQYSVPVQYCGKSVTIKALPEQIEIWQGGERIATHPRSYGRYGSRYQLEHYLPLLERKGRAIFQAKPVRDNVPREFLDWLSRQERSPKELVELLRYSMEIGFEAVMRGEAPPVDAPAVDISDPVSVAEPDLTAYDSLTTLQEVSV